MKNKGFTLTELLVVIVILGIITGISIPLIRNLSASFENRKYKNYADSVSASAKLYNNSYSEDLFGHKEYGCAYITYDELVKRSLIKDIDISDVSCNSQKTYVRVVKQRDKYGYSTYVSCGKKENGKAVSEDVLIPDVIPDIDESSCTGVDANNLSITADLSMADANISGNPFNKKRKTTRVMITSGTGIANNISISTTWSNNDCTLSSNCNNLSGWEKSVFKLNGNQEKKLLEGNSISSKSNELITPEGVSGKYYLIVRVDKLQDLYGSDWKNTANSNSKYLSFGPFSVDNEKPKIIANAYKCNNATATRTKTGNSLKTSTQVIGNGEINLFDLAGNSSGWLGTTNYQNGVCLEYSLSDNSGVKSASFQQNNANIKENATGVKTLNTATDTKTYTNGTTQTYSTYIASDGHRYTRLTVKDFAGNKSYIDVEAKIDLTAPTCGTVASSADGTAGVTGTVSCGSDAMSGCGGNGTYSQKKASLNVNITDKAGNTKACPVTIYSLAVVNSYCNQNGTGCGSNTTTTYYKLSGKTQTVSSTSKSGYSAPSNSQAVTYNANHTVTFNHTQIVTYPNKGAGSNNAKYSVSQSSNTGIKFSCTLGGDFQVWATGTAGYGEGPFLSLDSGGVLTYSRIESGGYDASHNKIYGTYFVSSSNDNTTMQFRPYIVLKYRVDGAAYGSDAIKQPHTSITTANGPQKNGYTFRTWQVYSYTNAGALTACKTGDGWSQNVYYPAGYQVPTTAWNLHNNSYPCPLHYSYLNGKLTVVFQAVWQKNPWTLLDSTVKEGTKP